MRLAVDVLPEVLDPRSLQEPVDGPRRRLAQDARGWRGEPVEVRGQSLLEPSLDVHVRVELVDDVNRQRRPKLVVLEKLRARVDPSVCVERLPLDPDRQRADQENQCPEAEQAPGQERACPRAQASGRLVGSIHSTTIVASGGRSIITCRLQSPG